MGSSDFGSKPSEEGARCARALQMAEKALEVVQKEDNVKKLKAVIDKAKEDHPEDQMMRQMQMMAQLLALGQELVGESWKDFGVTSENAMPTFLQVQMIAA